MDPLHLYIGLAALFGLFMAWGIGANDVANAMATSIGSGALTIRQALIVAAIFEFAGAVLAGGEVTSTIRKGMVDATLFADQPELFIYGMLATLLAAGTWLLIASRNGWPVSTTHSIVGAIVGFAVVAVGVDAVKWSKVGSIVMSWVISPLTAGIIAFFVFSSIQWLILARDNPLERARRYAPFYVFVSVMLIALVTMFKGLKHVGLDLDVWESYAIAIICGLIVALVSKISINRIQVDKEANKDFHYHTVERVFAVLMVVTAAAMAFAHGSNDVANAIGPVAAVVSTAQQGVVGSDSNVSVWILILGGIGIVVGLGTYGRHVIRTVGTNITQLTPSRGFAASIAAAFTIVVASGTGMPISTTHTLIGAVLGVGMARGISAINLGVVGRIFLSWITTIPAGAGLAVIFFFLLQAILPILISS
ncbi:MAG: inorganic phosphate transporter [Gammaproteobacteria bacterium]|nr:inorganic phosphate transporter [Gammaproteobacteria bacterium]MCP4089584.1 inorganic phosphate transporter [Gammaproteobacteria bacterium]MCP4278081.1 inorganic phosphate transporter [Gammaproteobacteria bacterium]MCP4832475.1 inorganic phosphate transporter [Gammaproteobacteria bacterium]MCP4930167.1 inorganic phosphate transporter [Gammaproteobacteria bacterium]